jgi:hypothetical protein
MTSLNRSGKAEKGCRLPATDRLSRRVYMTDKELANAAALLL